MEHGWHRSSEITDADWQRLLLRQKETQQQMLPFQEDEELKAKTNAFDDEWQNAADREKKSRSLFAQNTIKPDEVAREVELIQSAIGSATDVQNFLCDSTRAFRGTVGVIKINNQGEPMSDSKVEERLDSLEQQVRFLMEQIQSAPASSAGGQRDWRKSVGMFKDRPVMKEIDAEGQRIREEDRERTANDHS